MSEALEKVISDDQRAALALAISRSGGDLPQSLDALADQFGVTAVDVAELLNDPSFIKLIRGLTRAQASLIFNGNIQKLGRIVAAGKNKDVLTAMGMLGKVSGDLVNRHTVDVRHTFEDLRRNANLAGDPLDGLFDIRGDVIEADPVNAEIADEEAGYSEWKAKQ